MAEISYHREGDYLLPNLTVPDSPEIGIWGMRRRDYLRKHRSGIYTALLLTGKLNDHLEEVDWAAEEMFLRLVKELAETEGITETFKATNQMEWVRRMNAVRETAYELVSNELIFE